MRGDKGFDVILKDAMPSDVFVFECNNDTKE